MSTMKIKKGDMVKVIAGKTKTKKAKLSLLIRKTVQFSLRVSTC